MAIQNSLVKKNKDEQVSVFEVGGKTVRLSPAIVKNYLVNGNGNITMQEVVMFINLCKFSGLNPFVREAYLIT